MARFLLIILILAACAPRDQMAFAPEAADDAVNRTVFVGTTRKINATTGRFGSGRSEAMQFARYDIAIPPQHRPGKIDWPKSPRRPNPETDFLTTAEVIHPDARAFRADLAHAISNGARGTRDVVIFVHGFNNTFSGGLYRIAQLSHDLNMPGVTVHYSWPSAGNPLGYVNDRDAALFARDGLEVLMDQVIAAGAEKIFLVAHSMGAALTMEALRQVAIRGDQRVQSRIGGVFLISPDIDIDVFRAQAHAMGKLPQPFVIFGSDNDRMLYVVAKLTGEAERLGNISDVSRLADLEVTLLDVAAYTEGAGHFALGDSPALIGLMDRITDLDAAFATDRRGRVGFLPGVVLTVRNATKIILTPVVAISGRSRE